MLAHYLAMGMLMGIASGCQESGTPRSTLSAAQPAASKQPTQSSGEEARVVEHAEHAEHAGDGGIVEPEADAALRRMSAYLGRLASFRVDTTITDELITDDGQKIQLVKETKVSLRRPDRLFAERTGPAGRVFLRYNGKQISVHSPELGVYAEEAASADLKSTLDFARDRLGIEAPAADLLLPDTYPELIDGVLVGRYIGREPIHGVRAHHLAMTEKDVDWQIWIKDGPDPMPLRYVVTTKTSPSRPQFTAELRNWQPGAALSDEQFSFTPPAGAKRLRFDELQKIRTAKRREAAQTK